jgi:hypothetical protein
MGKYRWTNMVWNLHSFLSINPELLSNPGLNRRRKMNNCLLKFALAIVAIAGVSMVLTIGPAEAALIGLGEGPGINHNEDIMSDLLGEHYGIDDFEVGLGIKLEIENGVVDEDKTEGGLTDFGFDPNSGAISWNVTNCNVFGIAAKYGNTWLYWAITEDQLQEGGGIIPTEYNGYEISNIAVYVPDGSVMLLLGTSLLALALLGRRKHKN